jgi:hypothetical protein
MTNKSSKRSSRLPVTATPSTDAIPTRDRFETASADSFPASDAPGWAAVTGVGAPHTSGGPLDNKKRP